MKKLLVAVLAMTAASFVQTASAQSITFSPASGTHSVGDTVTITVVGDTNGELANGGTAVFDWTPSVFEISNAQKHPDSPFNLPFGADPNNASGHFEIAFSTPNPSVPVAYNGPLVTFDLLVQSGVGDSSLVWDVANTTFASQQGLIPTSSDDATFTTQAGQNDAPTVVVNVPATSTVTVPFSQTSIAFSGTASDPDGTVASVQVELNGEGFQTATGTTNWSFTVVGLNEGPNTVLVRAVDNESAVSPVVTRTVIRSTVDVDPDDFFVLTQFQDIWVSSNTTGTYPIPVRMNGVGFEHNPAQKKKTMVGDFDSDGDVDFLYVNPRGELWLARNLANSPMALSPARGESPLLSPTVLLSTGWDFDEAARTTVLAGDFNGDGLVDVVLLDGLNEQARFGFNNGTTIPSPGSPAAGPLYNPSGGIHLFVGDVNGDGKDDLIEYTNGVDNGALRLALSSDNGFGLIGQRNINIGFVHDPANQQGIHVGDFNNDGFADIAQVDTTKDVKVILFKLSFPSYDPDNTVSSTLAFRDDPTSGKGWWVFAAQANGIGGDDLVQINEFGQAWIASSNGNGTFAPSFRSTPLGYEHKPQGLWQVFVGSAE